jgi:S1-C subfamily serine protease
VLTTGLLPNADRVWIEYNKEYYLAESLGSDTLCNLSLLKTYKKPESFNFISFSANDNPVLPGSILLGLTFALEFQISPTIGIMQSSESTFGRNLFPTKMFRTSLALGPGEVGAPVFDLNGNFVGITHAALPDLRSSFILPAKACSRIRDGLILSGSVDYGWFGITVTRKLNTRNGFDIEIKSPGNNKKLKVGDILVKIGNTSIFDSGDILDSTFYARPGTFVEFLVMRDGKELIIPIRVAPRPKPKKLDLVQSNFTKGGNDINSSLITSKPNDSLEHNKSKF